MLRVLHPSIPVESQRTTVVPLSLRRNRAIEFDAGRLEEVVERLSAYVDACLIDQAPAMDPWLSEDELELRLRAI